MFICLQNRFNTVCFLALLFMGVAAHGASTASWNGVLTDNSGKAIAGASITLKSSSAGHDYTAETTTDGEFAFAAIAIGAYEISVNVGGDVHRAEAPLRVNGQGTTIGTSLKISSSGAVLQVNPPPSELSLAAAQPSTQASGGERLSSGEVSSLPLNARDFSKLLLLAAGTMTDANGAANFTQQFAVNGERGVTTIFAMDGFDTTDPEMGGATFSNFNVDAIQEVQSNSGVMPAEVGHGAASYTNVVTKSGVNQIHGSMFEFLRNASARRAQLFRLQRSDWAQAHSSFPAK